MATPFKYMGRRVQTTSDYFLSVRGLICLHLLKETDVCLVYITIFIDVPFVVFTLFSLTYVPRYQGRVFVYKVLMSILRVPFFLLFFWTETVSRLQYEYRLLFVNRATLTHVHPLTFLRTRPD